MKGCDRKRNLSVPPLQQHSLFPRPLHCHFSLHVLLSGLNVAVTFPAHLCFVPLISLSVHTPAQFHSFLARPSKLPCCFLTMCFLFFYLFKCEMCYSIWPPWGYKKKKNSNENCSVEYKITQMIGAASSLWCPWSRRTRNLRRHIWLLPV